MTRLYFDNAATSFPKPECVYEAVDRYQRTAGGAFGRGQHTAACAADALVNQCRSRIAQLLNAESANTIALTFNCTDSLNLLLLGILRTGDQVVATTLEHNSVLRPLHQLKQTKGIELQLAAHDPLTGTVSVDNVMQLVNSKTRLVVLSHASNVSGALQPVHEIANQLRSHDVALLLDAAQTVGHVPIDLQSLHVDFLAAAGHKGLLGPLGTGLIYVRPGKEAHLQPVRCGGTGTDSESLQQPCSMPQLFESGNLNMPGIAGLDAAVHFLLTSDQPDPSTKLIQDLRRRLAKIRGVRLQFPSASPAVPLVSFTVDNFDSREIAMILDQSFKIQCRAGFHCAPLAHDEIVKSGGGSIRISPSRFHNFSDIDTVVDAIGQIAALA